MDRWGSGDTIKIITSKELLAMQISEKSFLIEERLIHQLNCLINVSEALTKRIVEVQERLEALERASSPTKAARNESYKELLKESEIKLRHLKEILINQ